MLRSTKQGPFPITPQHRNPSTPSETWDDDFVFNHSNVEAQSLFETDDLLEVRNTRIDHTENVKLPRTPQREVPEGLRAWSESPTSPRQRAALGPKQDSMDERENWDDDFLDSTDSPARSIVPIRSKFISRAIRRAEPSEEAEEENWDEEFNQGLGIRSSGLVPHVCSRDSHTERTREGVVSYDSSEDEEPELDREMGFDRNDEDKTVTSRSRRRPLAPLENDGCPPHSLPPLPPLPTFLPTIPSGDAAVSYASPPSPFPRISPSHSVFSIPATTTSGHRDRDSTYGSTAHLALSLRRTHSAESSPSSPRPVKYINPDRFPQSPEAPRERRRLRKKSRPPHLDSSILELDDKPGSEPMFYRPSTPDSRPHTPPNVVAVAKDAVTSTSYDQQSTSHPTPTSPTSSSKSPLLSRIGSMRRWGRKRASAVADTEQSSSGHSEQHVVSPPAAIKGSRTGPLSGTADAEADRCDNNRTPRPRTRPSTNVTPSSVSARAVDVDDPPQSPSRNRFFRGLSSRMDASASNPAKPSISFESEALKRGTSGERERLRVAIPSAVPIAPQSSQSGESEASVNLSPRRARIRAFGQRLLPSKRSTSASSAERAKDSSEGDSSSQGLHGHGQMATPLNGPTPTRLRPRIPSSHHTKVRPTMPRHVSGSALAESHSCKPLAPAIVTGGRSVSATASTETAASSDDLTHAERGTALDEKGGQRKCMGSLRRISLAGAHSHHQRQQQEAGGHSRPQSPASEVPPVPPLTLSSDLKSEETRLSPLRERKDTRSAPQSTPASVHVDLASPTTSAPHDWLSSSPCRADDPPLLSHSKSSSFATPSSLGQSTALSRAGPTTQAASLGRSSPLPFGTSTSGSVNANGGVNVLRRSSLGDLKIPNRISRAQDGLKRDLGRVREFAARVQDMQELRASYFTIAAQIQSILNAPRPPSRAASPTSNLFGLSRSNSKARSSINHIDFKGLAQGFRAIDEKYSIAWECADLLIELGTGNSIEPPVQASGQIDVELSDTASLGRRKNRERAITLSGEEGKPDSSLMDPISPKNWPYGSPPAIVSWRATSGRNDFAHRQLYLLREMLNNTDPGKGGVHIDARGLPSNPEWAVADEAMDSSFTLPTEESVAQNVPPDPTAKKRRPSRLIGIRDMLRSLKRNTTRARQGHQESVIARSSTTLNTDSSLDSQPRPVENPPHGYNTIASIPLKSGNSRRKSETAAAAVDSMRSPEPDFGPFTGRLPLAHKSSPRRPSLASLFRLGQKHKAAAASSSTELPEQHNQSHENEAMDIPGRSVPEGKECTGDKSHEEAEIDVDIEDSDWDRMDSMSDVDVQIAAIVDEAAGQASTMKLRKKKQQHRLSMPPTTRPFTPKYRSHPYNSSQGSFATPDQSSTNIRSARLSNVDENNASVSSTALAAIGSVQSSATSRTSRRPRSRAGNDDDNHDQNQLSSVRAGPPDSVEGVATPAESLGFKLAMTPENIKPLLENARVVTSRLHDCIAEIKGLLVRTEGNAFTLSVSASSSNVAQ